MGKESKKRVDICITDSLCWTAEIHNIADSSFQTKINFKKGMPNKEKERANKQEQTKERKVAEKEGKSRGRSEKAHKLCLNTYLQYRTERCVIPTQAFRGPY